MSTVAVALSPPLACIFICIHFITLPLFLPLFIRAHLLSWVVSLRSALMALFMSAHLILRPVPFCPQPFPTTPSPISICQGFHFHHNPRTYFFVFFILFVQSQTFISRMALDGLLFSPQLLHDLTLLLSVYLISVSPRHSHVFSSFIPPPYSAFCIAYVHLCHT